MISSINCSSRLGQNIVQSENGGVYLTEVKKKLKGQFSGKEIGRAMKHVFKGTLVKSVRSKEHWESLTKVCLGLQWKQKETVLNIHQDVRASDTVLTLQVTSLIHLKKLQ